MEIPDITKHYVKNFARFVKKMKFRAGTLEAGEDVVQTAYERALRYHKGCDPTRFDQWFSMLLNNSLRDYKNSEKGYTHMDEDENEGTIECSSYPNHVMREIYELIDTKSEIQIEVLMLHLKQGYSAIDISKQIDCSYAKAHQIIQRFKNELKELYS